MTGFVTRANTNSGFVTALTATSDIVPPKVANQCAQAVTAAQAATAAGTQVFSVAYGASTATSGNSSSCTTDTPTRISACTTMQTIASDSGKFYSTDSSCSSTNNITQLPSVFQAISTSLTSQTKPRLLTQ